MQALGGTLVVDFTRFLPGAFASREFQQHGARVIRVEQPGGDPMRLTAPEWYDALNAGKESVVCELPGEGEFDIPGYVAVAQDMGYPGPWGVEVLSNELRELPIEETFQRAYDTSISQFHKASAPA